MAKRKHGRVKRTELPTLLEALKRDKTRVLRALHRHGVYFDTGTFVTLTATLDKVAAYHAVADKEKFYTDLLGA